MPTASTLIGRRVLLRPLVVEDFAAWQEVRARNADWLLKWEPMRTPGAPDPVQSRDAFAVRCGARQRERQLGTGYGYGIFVEGHFAGEINLSIVQRGPFQSSLRRLLDRREARPGRATCPRRSCCCAAPPSRTCTCTGSRSRSSPATPPAAGWSRSSRSATRASPSATSRSTACGRTTSATPSPSRSGTRAATSCWPTWIA